jgi:hypothetical protein
MPSKHVKEFLAAQVDHLVGLRAGPPPALTQHERAQGLLELADHLQAILVPVQPSAQFRRRLHGELILAAQQRQVEPETSRFRQHRKGILIGAAAIGSVASVVGVIIAVVVRHRHGGATRMAAG